METLGNLNKNLNNNKNKNKNNNYQCKDNRPLKIKVYTPINKIINTNINHHILLNQQSKKYGINEYSLKKNNMSNADLDKEISSNNYFLIGNYNDKINNFNNNNYKSKFISDDIYMTNINKLRYKKFCERTQLVRCKKERPTTSNNSKSNHKMGKYLNISNRGRPNNKIIYSFHTK